MTGAGEMPGPGEEVEVIVTTLEMTERPAGPYPPMPMAAPLTLVRSVEPPLRWFYHLYDVVGEQYEWTDRHGDDPEELQALLHDDDVALYVLMHDGWPGGFFMLDHRDRGVCELLYFGLAPELLGRGYGKWLLGEAVRMGWERTGVEKMTVSTNTLDHARALPLYQRAGFMPVDRRTETRALTRPLAPRAD
ncbi:GNAT family N-acetyltransferase [Rhodovulum sp. DZ06]|uniref:GNAT family N-acetyltransferase n=1 Tax=Rhodovulum sp. DZ06 TaxID=3425126 RepID=UPI003D325502